MAKDRRTTNSFETMKQTICIETLLSSPDFSQPFDLRTDASHSYLGAVLLHLIAFYSRKLNPSQEQFTITERNLLAIV
jgi:RNase H-like domain found in reverse transcriptase